MALLASAVVERVDASTPSGLWHRVAGSAGVSRAQYDIYFQGAMQAVGLWLADIKALERPPSLSVS